MIATDVAARGLDIAQLEQVVNYDMPFKANSKRLSVYSIHVFLKNG
ncbi:ATP-dependent RNA helicase [Vibrio cholerae]|nr:ATP-dependent RNA helicase [Vibrio cholerae]